MLFEVRKIFIEECLIRSTSFYLKCVGTMIFSENSILLNIKYFSSFVCYIIIKCEYLETNVPIHTMNKMQE